MGYAGMQDCNDYGAASCQCYAVRVNRYIQSPPHHCG